MEKLLLKPSEVTEILGISRSLFYELIARKEIPSIRLGRCVRVPKVSLENWIKAHETSQDSVSTNAELSGSPGEAAVSG